ncbi:MAG TPA: hypothetical protein DCL73_17045 [Treponema sp.]|nr:hypothetical protein [Treponema sp.]
MKKIHIIFCMILAAAGISVSAQEAALSGSVKSAAGVYVYGEDNAGHVSLAEETVSGTLDASAGSCSAYATGNVSFDALAAAQTGTLSAADGLSAQLDEAWFAWTSAAFGDGLAAGIKAGRQITAWGKADGIRIADVLCPQDLTTLYASTYSESRLGVDALKLNLSGTVFSADAYWIPVFRPSALPLESTNPLRKIVIPESVTVSGTTIPVTLGSIERPELTLAAGSYAGRVSFWLPAIDFSLYGYYGWDDTPVVTYSLVMSGYTPTGITVSGNYYRYGMAGFDAALPAGPFVFRAESAFFIERAFARTAETVLAGGSPYLRKNQLMSLAGIDWTRSGWTVTAQYYEDIVPGWDDTLDRRMRAPGATLSVSRSFLSDTLTLALSGAVNWNDFDSYASLSADYALTDQVTLTLAADGFFPGPDGDGEYGVYKELSNVRLNGVYRF